MENNELLNKKFHPISFIYVLALQNDKYYVGFTCNPNQRIKEHFVGKGSEWTRKHKPISVLEIYVGDSQEEKSKTLQLMSEKGWENVRGYCWCQVDLPYPPTKIKADLIVNKIENDDESRMSIKLNNIDSIYSHIENNKLYNYVYVLKLENNKYYVGSNATQANKFERHFEGNGSPWTKTYKPVEMVSIVEGNKQKEKQITLQMMKKFGWENVRGYAWSQINMKNPPKDLIQ